MSLDNETRYDQQLEVEPECAGVFGRPTHEQIKIRAHELWLLRSRNGIEGTADHDWSAAEEQLSIP